MVDIFLKVKSSEYRAMKRQLLDLATENKALKADLEKLTKKLETSSKKEAKNKKEVTE